MNFLHTQAQVSVIIVMDNNYKLGYIEMHG